MIRKVMTAPLRLAQGAVRAGLKAFSMRWTGRAQYGWQFLLPRTKFDYGKEVGDGTGSNIVMACVLWIARMFPEAPVQVLEEKEDGERVRIPRHALPRKNTPVTPSRKAKGKNTTVGVSVLPTSGQPTSRIAPGTEAD